MQAILDNTSPRECMKVAIKAQLTDNGQSSLEDLWEEQQAGSTSSRDDLWEVQHAGSTSSRHDLWEDPHAGSTS